MEDLVVKEEIAEKPVAKKTTRKPRATKKVAEEAPVKVDNVNIEEGGTVNEDGQEVISGPAKKRGARSSNMQSKEDNTLSSRAADAALSKKNDVEEPKKDDSAKTALWSDKNIRWSDVGTLTKGYNIVTEEAAEKWLTRAGIRKATPEEVATYYSK